MTILLNIINYLMLHRPKVIRLTLSVAGIVLLSFAVTSCKDKEIGQEETAKIEVNKPGKEETAKIKASKLEKKAIVNPYGVPAPPGKAITKSEIKAVDARGKERMDDAITCLARTIYWEARGTDRKVMHAVANVVMNRLGSEDFPDTICGIVKQGKEERACQFSWWCDGRPDSAQEERPYEAAKEIARKALNRQLKDVTGGALYFHSKGVRPSWSKKFKKTVKIGNVDFYKPADGKTK